MQPLSVSVKSAADMIGVSRGKIYLLINEGKLDTFKVGSRTLVKVASVRALAGEAA